MPKPEPTPAPVPSPATPAAPAAPAVTPATPATPASPSAPAELAALPAPGPLPTVGRVVHFRNGPHYQNNPGRDSPALVTAVGPDGVCLTIFHPPMGATPGCVEHRTNCRQLGQGENGSGFGGWYWPPKS